MEQFRFVNILSNVIINTYLNGETTNCLYIITDAEATFEYNGDIPVVILKADLMIKHPTLYTKFYCENFIINTRNPKQTFTDVEFAIKSGDNRFNTRKYLVLPTSGLEKNTTEVFLSRAINYVSDIVAVFPDKTNVIDCDDNDIIFKLYTHRYVGMRDFNDVFVLDEWFSKNASFLHRSNLYPDKLTDQQGRTLRIGTITYKPYSEIGFFDGTELTVALEVAHRHNMTFIVKDFEQELWGEARENFTGDGILGNVAMDECDIGFAAMFMWEQDYRYLDVSKPFVRSGVTVLAPGPKLEGGWLTPFISFSTSMWIAWVFSLILCFVSILIVVSFSNPEIVAEMQENVIISIIQTEALFLSQSVSPIPNKLSSRLVYALLMILGLITATIYSSGLASNMTIPRYTRILRTNKDLADADIKWGATSLAWIYMIEGADNPLQQKLITTFVVAGEDNLTYLNKDEFGYAMERLQEGNFAVGDYVTAEGANNRRLLEEDIYHGFICLYTRKGSVLLPLIDKLLLDIAQGGLIQYWEYEAVSRHMNRTVQTIIKFSMQPPKAQITPLRFDHVEGAFALWALGLILATICFVYEIVHI